MLQVNPQKYLPLVYQLLDPTDTNTYYVQAVIKNSLTGTTLTTVGLTDGGGQRFTGSWQTDADPSGEGYYIDIIYTVYTDSGHTSTADYQRAIEGYFVHELWGLQFGHGGGADIDYKKLGRLMDKKLGEKFGALTMPENVDLSEISSRLADIEMAFVNLVIPETDLSELTNHILDVRKMVEMVPTKYADRSDINEMIIETGKNINRIMQTTIDKLNINSGERSDNYIKKLEEALEKMTIVVKDVKKHLDKKQFSIKNLSLQPLFLEEKEKPRINRNNKPSLLRK